MVERGARDGTEPRRGPGRGIVSRDRQTRNSREIEPQLGILAGYEYGPLRAGIGVFSERVVSGWSTGTCACTFVGSHEEVYSFPVAGVAARVPVGRGLAIEPRATGRDRPATELTNTDFPSEFMRDEGRVEVDLAIGLSGRFFLAGGTPAGARTGANRPR